jgi:chemotaxis signal transduction protein
VYLALPGGGAPPPHAALTGISGRYIEGIANLRDRLILILDLRTVLDFSQSIPAA